MIQKMAYLYFGAWLMTGVPLWGQAAASPQVIPSVWDPPSEVTTQPAPRQVGSPFPIRPALV